MICEIFKENANSFLRTFIILVSKSRDFEILKDFQDFVSIFKLLSRFLRILRLKEISGNF